MTKYMQLCFYEYSWNLYIITCRNLNCGRVVWETVKKKLQLDFSVSSEGIVNLSWIVYHPIWKTILVIKRCRTSIHMCMIYLQFHILKSIELVFWKLLGIWEKQQNWLIRIGKLHCGAGLLSLFLLIFIYFLGRMVLRPISISTNMGTI